MKSFATFTLIFIFSHFVFASHNCPRGPNERWTDCGNVCQENCINSRNTNCFTKCEIGYFCQKGFKRHGNGSCIDETSCECQDHNMEFNSCASACGDGCPVKNDDRACIAVCQPRCACKKGFKHDGMKCIPEKDCPVKCGGENEEFGLGNECENSCKRVTDVIACEKDLREGCYCIEGFKRNPDGKCVPIAECPCPKKNEKFNLCGNRCNDKCPNGTALICPAVCVKGCFCADNFKRDKNGNCVPLKECPKQPCKNPLEQWKVSNECTEACYKLDCWKQDEVGCKCKTGYRRDEHHNCIPEEKCPIPKCPNKLEEWRNDYSSCFEACFNSGCDKKENRPGCYCKEGYKRDIFTFECIKADQCKCPEENQVWMNYNKCEESCFATKACRNETNHFGCFCKSMPKESFKKDINGKCIPAKQCPKEPICPEPKFESFNLFGFRCGDYCDKARRLCKAFPAPDCICNDGFARDLRSDKCRPYSQDKGCEPEDCGENAGWQNNVPRCDEYCEIPKDCINSSKDKNFSGCRCDKGYVRETLDSTSRCIKKWQCKNQKG